MDIENTFQSDISKLQKHQDSLGGKLKLSQKIQELTSTNKLSISSILVLLPSTTIPMYYDWRHPLVGISLGLLSQIAIVLISTEQITKQKKNNF